MDNIKEVLIALKNEVKEKDYNDPAPKISKCGDYLYSYCIERTLINQQPTLAISRVDRKRFVLPQDATVAIHDVFGDEYLIFDRMFPNRGNTLMLVWTHLK